MSSVGCRIVQFSDLHLSSTGSRILKGIDCWQQLHRMLAHLGRQRDVDGLVLTGDIAHDESRETYEELQYILDNQNIPYWLIPGNHDDPVLMRSIFSRDLIQNKGSMSFCALLNDVAVVGLDTHMPGSDGGRLSASTLDWFDKQCEFHANRSMMVFMHHPPLDTGDVFFDSIGLADRGDFWETIKTYPQIKGIGFGHLHRPIRLAPSPWVQGAPSVAFSMEDTGAGLKARAHGTGYLLWCLSPNGIKTEVLGAD